MNMRNIPFGFPLIGDEEKAAVMKVLDGPILVHGPVSKQFEQDFAAFSGAPYALATANCTASLHLCHFYHGLKQGEEVIVPAMTHTATAHAVELAGGRPVFVDAELRTGNIDLDAVEAAVTSKTRGISIVHYLGMPVDMERINAIADRHGLYVIEDCALSIGAEFRGVHTGLWGDAGCFSFYPVKHMTTAEGGMLITKHKQMAEKITFQKAFGVDRTAGERSIPGVYDVTMLGFNYRMSEVHAAIGIEQLKRIKDFLVRRKSNYEALTNALRRIERISVFQSSQGDFLSSHYCHSVLIDKRLSKHRVDIINSMKAAGIGTSVYYPRAVPDFTYYRGKYKYPDTAFPNARQIAECSIALPVGPHLNIDDMEYIAAELEKNIKGVQRNG